MTEKETELIHIIREADNPEAALKTAVGIILAFLQQHESCRVPSADYHPEPS